MSANSSTPEGNTRITITVKGSDGSLQKFNMKKNNCFKKLMDTYARIKNHNINLIAFYFNGNLLRPHDTPKGVEIKEGDVINAFVIRVFLNFLVWFIPAFTPLK